MDLNSEPENKFNLNQQDHLLLATVVCFSVLWETLNLKIWRRRHSLDSWSPSKQNCEFFSGTSRFIRLSNSSKGTSMFQWNIISFQSTAGLTSCFLLLLSTLLTNYNSLRKSILVCVAAFSCFTSGLLRVLLWNLKKRIRVLDCSVCMQFPLDRKENKIVSWHKALHFES